MRFSLAVIAVAGFSTYEAVAAPPTVDSPEAAIAIAQHVCAKEINSLESKPDSSPTKWEAKFSDQEWQVEGSSGRVGSSGVAVTIPREDGVSLRCVETVLVPGHSPR